MTHPTIPVTGQVVDQLIYLYDTPGRPTSTAQRTGLTCTWCGAPEPGVDLGGTAPWRPHGCEACYRPKRAWWETYLRWHGHIHRCPRCSSAQGCTVAHGYRILHEDAASDAGRTAPSCIRCSQPIRAVQPIEPMISDGNAGMLYGYAHLGQCPPRRTR
jgi:hypothetical protein